MGTFILGGDPGVNGSYSSYLATGTPYHIGQPVSFGGKIIVESITLQLSNRNLDGTYSGTAQAGAAIWNSSGSRLFKSVEEQITTTTTTRWQYIDFSTDDYYLSNGTYYFGLSRDSNTKIAIHNPNGNENVDVRTSGTSGPGDSTLDTNPTSAQTSSRSLTGYVTYRDATVPDEPTFTLDQGYGSVIINDLSTGSDVIGITGYQYSLNGGAWVNFSPSGDPLNNGDGSYTISGLSVGSEYNVRVRAANDVGWSVASTYEYATPYGLPSVSNVTADYDSAVNDIYVNWDSDDNYDENGISYYHIYRSVNGGVFGYYRQTDAIETANLSYTDTSISIGNTYQYRVYALNRAGWGGYSQSNAELAVVAPTIPRSFQALEVKATSVKLSWLAPSSNGGSPIDYYTISIDGVDVLNPDSNVFLTTVTGLDPNTEYLFGISATNNAGLTGPEATILVKTLGGLPRVWNAATNSWDYGIIKQYDSSTDQWNMVLIKYYNSATGNWEYYNS